MCPATKVLVSGEEIDLTASEFKLLLTALSRYPGRGQPHGGWWKRCSATTSRATSVPSILM